MNKVTGAVTFIRCTICKRETMEFATSNEARRWATENGWVRLAPHFLCPACAKKMAKELKQKVDK